MNRHLSEQSGEKAALGPEREALLQEWIGALSRY